MDFLWRIVDSLQQQHPENPSTSSIFFNFQHAQKNMKTHEFALQSFQASFIRIGFLFSYQLQSPSLTQRYNNSIRDS
jgi:hypothetical protein